MPDPRHDCDPSSPPRPPDRRAAPASARTRAAYTLLVRLWKETPFDDAAPPVWRGTVSDLRGRRLGSFSSAAELAEIVGEMARMNVLLRISHADAEEGGTPDGADAPRAT